MKQACEARSAGDRMCFTPNQLPMRSHSGLKADSVYSLVGRKQGLQYGAVNTSLS